MTEAISSSSDSSHRHVGQLLQTARLAAGLDIAVLAAVLKVPVAKLEALERHDLNAVGDVTFVRTLTKTVCRHLGVDSGPLLEQLPHPSVVRLSVSAQSVETPYQPAGRSLYGVRRLFGSRLLWAVLGMVLLTTLLAIFPTQWLDDAAAWWEDVTGPTPEAVVVITPDVQPATAPNVADALPADAPAVAPVMVLPAETAPGVNVAAAPTPVQPVASPAVETPIQAAQPAPTAAKWLLLTAQADSWVELSDSSGKVISQRLMKAGDVLDADSPAPVRLVVGNARAVTVTLKGQPFDLTPHTKANVARVTIE